MPGICLTYRCAHSLLVRPPFHSCMSARRDCFSSQSFNAKLDIMSAAPAHNARHRASVNISMQSRSDKIDGGRKSVTILCMLMHVIDREREREREEAKNLLVTANKVLVCVCVPRTCIHERLPYSRDIRVFLFAHTSFTAEDR